MEIRGGRVFCPDGVFRDTDIYIENGRFTESSSDGHIMNAAGYYIIPGLIDIHMHGCVGYDFSSATVQQIRAMGEYLAGFGVTNFCPAVMSLPEEQMAEAFRNAVEYEAHRGCGAYLRALRMEGPFLSPEKSGAQDEQYFREPDKDLVERMQKEADGLLRIIDVAPELYGSLALIHDLAGRYRISLGHSTADYKRTMAAFDAGATQVTHLYNGMIPMHHREPGMIGAAMDQERCFVELIGDGVHVDDAMLRNTFRMFGDDRIILVSDCMSATGMEDGMYLLGGKQVRVEDGVATLAGTNVLAGSTMNLMECFLHTVKKARVRMESVVKAVTENPARSLGIFSQYGSLEPGKIAHILILDEDLNLVSVIF